TSFFGLGFLGAALSGLLAWIWFWAADGLWRRDTQAWLFVICVVALSLIFDGVALLAGAPFAARMPSIVLAVVAPLLALLPSPRAPLPPHPPAWGRPAPKRPPPVTPGGARRGHAHSLGREGTAGARKRGLHRPRRGDHPCHRDRRHRGHRRGGRQL